MFLDLLATIKFNKSCIWYVQSSSGGKNTKQGSAVAIKLRKKGEKGAWKVHLLTCAHVIRSGKDGKGEVQKEIYAWRTNKKFEPKLGIKASMSPLIGPSQIFCPLSKLPDTLDMNDWVENDWVILSFEVEQFSHTVMSWQKAVPYTSVDIYGIPEGYKSFSNNKVSITRSKDIFLDRVGSDKNPPNSLDLTSDDSRPGMSGGGVFNHNTNTLVGLHRSRNVAIMELRSVPMEHIVSVINQNGYEFFVKESTAVFKILLYSTLIILFLLIFMLSV